MELGTVSDWVGIAASSLAAGTAAWVAWRQYRDNKADRAFHHARADKRYFDGFAELRGAVVRARNATIALTRAEEGERTNSFRAWYRALNASRESAAAVSRTAEQVTLAVLSAMVAETCDLGDGDMNLLGGESHARTILPLLDEHLGVIEKLQGAPVP
jgi:hypothetical protein